MLSDIDTNPSSLGKAVKGYVEMKRAGISSGAELCSAWTGEGARPYTIRPHMIRGAEFCLAWTDEGVRPYTI